MLNALDQIRGFKECDHTEQALQSASLTVSYRKCSSASKYDTYNALSYLMSMHEAGMAIF